MSYLIVSTGGDGSVHAILAGEIEIERASPTSTTTIRVGAAEVLGARMLIAQVVSYPEHPPISVAEPASQ